MRINKWKVGDKVMLPDPSFSNGVITKIINERLVRVAGIRTLANSLNPKRKVEVTAIANTLKPANGQYGKTSIHERKRFGALVEWNGIDIEIANVNYPVDRYYEWYANGQLDLNPAYQRGLVWTLKQKQAYIMALLKERVKLQTVLILTKTREKEDYFEVLDGKQRLNSIFEFIDNEYPLETGEYFDDLSEKDMNAITEPLSIMKRIYCYDAEVPLDFKLEYFLEINALGTKMSDEHLEKVEKELEKITKGEKQ